MTPGTQGALYGAKTKTRPGASHFSFKMPKKKNNTNQQKNETNKQDKPKEPAPAKSWAEVATLNIPNEVMQ